MEGHCSTGQSPRRAVVPMEEEEEVRQGLFHQKHSSKDVDVTACSVLP